VAILTRPAVGLPETTDVRFWDITAIDDQSPMAVGLLPFCGVKKLLELLRRDLKQDHRGLVEMLPEL
jgi:hypothetical protein